MWCLFEGCTLSGAALIRANTVINIIISNKHKYRFFTSMPSVHCKRIASHCSHPRVARLSWNDWNSDHFGNLYRNIQPLSVTMGLVNAWISLRVKLKGCYFQQGADFIFSTFQLNNCYDIAFYSRQKIEHLKQEKWNASLNRTLNLCVWYIHLAFKVL